MQVQFGFQNFFTSVEVKSGNSRTRKFTDESRKGLLVFPRCQMLNHKGSVYMINGKPILKFDEGIWKHHSAINTLGNATTVSTDIGIFIFHDLAPFEYLLNDHTIQRTCLKLTSFPTPSTSVASTSASWSTPRTCPTSA